MVVTNQKYCMVAFYNLKAVYLIIIIANQWWSETIIIVKNLQNGSTQKVNIDWANKQELKDKPQQLVIKTSTY